MKKDLHNYFEEFINECRFISRLSTETIRGYTAVFNLFLKIMPEISTVSLLTVEMLTEFFKRIQLRQRKVGRNILKVGVKKSTIKTQWSKLNVFFVWLHRRNYIEENPLKNIKPPNPDYDDPRALENDEIHKIYTSIILRSSNLFTLRRDTLMISLLLFCGLRKSEFISLQVRDIDMYKQELTIRAETSKSKKMRVLKMHPTLLLHLKDYIHERNIRGLKSESLLVADKVDKGLTRDGLKHWVKRLIEKSGINFHLHRFRHTFACKLSEANVNAFKIQKMMGHSNMSMTMKYARSLRTEDMGNDISQISI
jgi:site-specific recombinase XerD